MKKFFTILVAILVTATVFSQTPEKMSYQAVIRDGSNNLVGNTTIGMRISILQGSESGTVVYAETQAPTTNVNGLVSMEIGGGDGFSGINWGNGIYFIKTETDPTGGNNYTITGTSQILSVPYALYAKTAETLSPGTYPGQMLYWNGTAWDFVQVPANSEGATLTLINGTPTWTGGGAMSTAPDAPIIGIATAGNAQASVLFTAPASNGGSPITSYTATSNPGNITGTVTQAGSGTITVAGLTNGTAYTFTVTATNAIGTSAPSAPSNSVTPTGLGTDVINPITGEVWMDRNLGATQVADSSRDEAAYGDLYQWGRGTDGHQIRTSSITTTLSSTDDPGHGDYIIPPIDPYDWRSPQNNDLWQGVNGVNNPCPAGYRIPTLVELNAERESWSSSNAAGAYASPLKFTVAGYRYGFAGLHEVGLYGGYWTSTAEGNFTRMMLITPDFAFMGCDLRSYGYSVRCIKD